MLWIPHFAKRVMENPKLLIAIAVLIAFALVLEFVVLAGPDNPLPAPDEVVQVSCLRGRGGAEASLDMGLYSQLHACLSGSERLITGNQGEPVATLVIHRRDGTTHRARLYQLGMVQTEDGMFAGGDNDKSNRLSSLIHQIGR